MENELEAAVKAYLTASEETQQEKLNALVAICKREGIRSFRLKEVHVRHFNDHPPMEGSN